jgi:AraC-like DNA-binding protein
VALDSGYRSVSLFNTLFKRRFGVSPSEWRRLAAEQQLPPLAAMVQPEATFRTHRARL